AITKMAEGTVVAISTVRNTWAGSAAVMMESGPAGPNSASSMNARMAETAAGTVAAIVIAPTDERTRTGPSKTRGGAALACAAVGVSAGTGGAAAAAS